MLRHLGYADLPAGPRDAPPMPDSATADLPRAGGRARIAAMPASAPISPLPPDRLYRRPTSRRCSFETTRELAPLHELADQPRAHEAIRFGTDMAVRGFNIFAIGANGARIQGSVRALLEDAAAKRPKPSDWVYVNNFATPHRPVAIALPPGRAPALDKALDGLIDDLKAVAARGVRERGLPEAPRRHRAGDPRPQRARLHRAARQGDGKGHRDPAHADGLRHGADEGRPGGAAGRVQRLAGGAPARGADGDRGTGKGSGRHAAPAAADGARTARRGACARSRDRAPRHRAADRGLQGAVRRSAEGGAAPRFDPGRHPGERRAVRRPAGARRRRRPARARRPVRSLRGERAGHHGRWRGRRAGDRGGASDTEQPGRPHRASRGAGRAGDQFPPDQAGQPASRQWRRDHDRSAQSAGRAAELGRAETRAAAPRDRRSRTPRGSWA